MPAELEVLEPAGGDPLIGTMVSDRYRIVRKLGEGGMGRVYEAEHVLIRKRVAIKCLHAQFVTDSGVVARFLREARAATAIGHEHIVDVTDMGRFPDGAVFMALEFLDGCDLGAAIDKGEAFTVGRAARIVSQICEALTAVHGKGIIHRDLKPENIYLVRRGDNPDFVKVLDFGISKFKDGGVGPTTGTGVMIGTPYSMAPEQMEGRSDIDHRADIYALGVIFFAMLTGRPPFDAPSILKLIIDVCTVKAPSVRDFRGDIPVGIEVVVARLLEKDRELRFPDAESLRKTLVPWLTLDESPEVPRSVGAPAEARPPARRLSDDEVMGATRLPAQRPPAAPPVAEATRAPRVEVLMGLTAFLVLFSIVVGAAINGLNRTTAPTSTTTAPRAPLAPAQPPTAVSAPAALSAPSRREVHITIRVEPPDAELWVNGTRVFTPYDGALDVGAHDIEVRREGYRTLLLRRVAIRNTQTIELRLQRGRLHGPVFGRLSTDDGGVSRVEVISPTVAAAPADPAVAGPPEAPSPGIPASNPPAAPVEPGRTSIDGQF